MMIVYFTARVFKTTRTLRFTAKLDELTSNEESSRTYTPHATKQNCR